MLCIPHWCFSVFSTEKLDVIFSFTWVRFICFTAEKDGWLQPKARICAKGVLELSVYLDKINLSCRVEEMREWMSMAGKRYNPDGPSAEERALERFTELMIKKISSIKGDWKKPWFTENFMAWPKNLSGREYNGMNALMLMLLCEENNY